MCTYVCIYGSEADYKCMMMTKTFIHNLNSVRTWVMTLADYKVHIKTT